MLEINLRRWKLLNPGGTLVTAAAPQRERSGASRRSFTRRRWTRRCSAPPSEKRAWGRDHPVLPLGAPRRQNGSIAVHPGESGVDGARLRAGRSPRDAPPWAPDRELVLLRGVATSASTFRTLRCARWRTRCSRRTAIEWSCRRRAGVRRPVDRWIGISRRSSIGIELLARLSPRVHAGSAAGLKAVARTERSVRPTAATTDAMCGALIGPLLASHPPLVASASPAAAGDRNMGCGVASAVSPRGLPRAKASRSRPHTASLQAATPIARFDPEGGRAAPREAENRPGPARRNLVGGAAGDPRNGCRGTLPAPTRRS